MKVAFVVSILLVIFLSYLDVVPVVYTLSHTSPTPSPPESTQKLESSSENDLFTPPPTDDSKDLGEDNDRLPTTGLTFLVWVLSPLIPVGFIVSKFGKHNKGENKTDPHFIWEDREYKKG